VKSAVSNKIISVNGEKKEAEFTTQNGITELKFKNIFVLKKNDRLLIE